MGKKQNFWDKVFRINELQKTEKLDFSSSVETYLKKYNFKKVTTVFSGDRKYYKSLRFERLKDEIIGEWIEVTFDKYGLRKFYISFGVTELFPEQNRILLGALVKKKNQSQYWWGAKWHSLSRKHAWARATRFAQIYIPQTIEYFDATSTGKNIHIRNLITV